MPTKGMSRQTDRDCIVCGQTTRIAHLGIECCRACAVFYRRAKRGNDYSCRANTGQCQTGKGLNCKKCRYDRLVTLLCRTGPLENAINIDEPSPSVQVPATLPKTERPFLERVKAQYNAMCFNRLTSELNSRPNPPHPLDISLVNGPFYKADFAALIRAIRMLLTATLEFGRTTFPDYAQMQQSDKWALATDFFYRFRVFEGCYRANKIFQDEPNIYFVSYAGYSKIPFDESFLSTAPPGADVAGAIAHMQKSEMVTYFKSARERIARVNPSEEEFLAVAVLMFWPYGDLTTSDSINRMGEKYRGELLKELHSYYREELGMDDYATRIGELMMLIQMFEKTEDLKVQFEVMRLFNIMTDDNFITRRLKMPSKGVSRQSDRDCIVCGQLTRIAHLGIECCRACAVFYRRAKRKNDFVCRSNTGRCPSGKNLNCKRCRLDRIVKLLDRPVAEQKDKDMDKASPSTEPAGLPPKSDRPFLDHVRSHYNTMCFTRLSSELNSRPDPPHPLEISLEKGPFFPADFAALIRSVRMMLTATLEFGRATFPEFAELTESEKWTLATNFFYRFRVFEGCYRANKHFPDKPDMYFTSYSGYCPFPLNEDFLKTAPPEADVIGAVEFWEKSEQKAYILSARELVARVNPSEEEFIVVAVLMFWTYGDPSTDDNIIKIGEKYGEKTQKELHSYYRDELGLTDYAARMGELMMIMQMFEKTRDLKEQFEVMRLFNIMTDDNFVYQLQKDD